MPCNSDHMEADDQEIRASQMWALIDELDGKGAPTPESWRGYHKKGYNKINDLATLARTLCERLQRLESLGGIDKCSFEMQMWWRDHQEADLRRIKAEIQAKKNEVERKAALAKLTAHERKLLGQLE